MLQEDICRFIEETEHLKTPGDTQNIDAVLQVSISANGNVYEKIKEDLKMCEALEQLMKKEIEAKVEAGRKEGTSNASLSHIRNIMAALHTSAEEAMNMLGIPMEERAFYISKIEK